ncbi:MAG TPA: thiamine-phosphate kinase [Anaerolineae bacterium]|jgi:thiamine-monophosphate kinase|nr:thiamine-phosphate kinase [Anaerolineae bacterium]
MKVKDIGEVALIERIAEIVEHADERVIVTIGDDTAVVKPTRLGYSLLTTDLLVEEVHFTLDTITPWQLGYKSISVNISDIAAMGGLPDYAVISLAVRPDTNVSLIEDIYRGMADVSRKYDLRIVGGDVTKSEKLIINVALLGEVEEENLRRRSDAVIGDVIMVTGELGASAAGLRIILNPEIEPKVREAGMLKRAHFLPEPRVEAGRVLTSLGIHAMEDISDGLASEIKHICEASSTGARLFLNKVPMARGVSKVAELTGERAIDIAIAGGEDYELVFTVPAELKAKVEKSMAAIGVKVAAIGEIVDSSYGIRVVDWSGVEKPLEISGYTHF